MLRSTLMAVGSGLRMFNFSISSFFSSVIFATPSFRYSCDLSCNGSDRLDASHTRLWHSPHPVLLCVLMREEFLERV